MRGQNIHQQCTHSHVSAVRLLRLSGIVPLSWLGPRLLHRKETQRCARVALPAAHAQVVQPRHVAQAGWDGAIELVEVEAAAVETKETQRSARAARLAVTHRTCSTVRLPRLDGMVPLSWLAPR